MVFSTAKKGDFPSGLALLTGYFLIKARCTCLRIQTIGWLKIYPTQPKSQQQKSDRTFQRFYEILFFLFGQSWLPYFKLPKQLANLKYPNTLK
jgi:hypothetical protein